MVSFHAHGRAGREGGIAQVCLPEHNVHNRWRFHRTGLPVLDEGWPETLEPLLPEGYYALTSELSFPGGRWPRGALLQLGYTRTSDPILFLAQQRLHAVENDLFFGEEGVRVPRSELPRLSPLVVFVEPDEDDERFPGHR